MLVSRARASRIRVLSPAEQFLHGRIVHGTLCTLSSQYVVCVCYGLEAGAPDGRGQVSTLRRVRVVHSHEFIVFISGHWADQHMDASLIQQFT